MDILSGRKENKKGHSCELNIIRKKFRDGAEGLYFIYRVRSGYNMFYSGMVLCVLTTEYLFSLLLFMMAMCQLKDSSPRTPLKSEVVKYPVANDI